MKNRNLIPLQGDKIYEDEKSSVSWCFSGISVNSQLCGITNPFLLRNTGREIGTYEFNCCCYVYCLMVQRYGENFTPPNFSCYFFNRLKQFVVPKIILKILSIVLIFFGIF